MKLFDVTVYQPNLFRDTVYRQGLSKKEAKNLVQELKSKGLKAQFITSKNRAIEGVIDIPENEED